MLTQSTSQLAQNALRTELNFLDWLKDHLKKQQKREANPYLGKRNQSELYYDLWKQRTKVKARRKKLANALKELKDFTWTGHPKDLE
ncbi:MAG TPA: hypothetical protein P5539_05505 [Mesotoga sp.]|nr:hypothetical protein [Mesotoga sp.]